MANKFRTSENIITEENEHSTTNEQRNSQKKDTANTSVKKVRKVIDSIFGLGILKKIDLKKNLPYFIMLVIMIIWLIHNSLKIQSKRTEIEIIKDDITKINDILMDIIEEEYNIDEKLEKQLLQTAKDEGFQSSGYIPYSIKIDKK